MTLHGGQLGGAWGEFCGTPSVGAAAARGGPAGLVGRTRPPAQHDARRGRHALYPHEFPTIDTALAAEAQTVPRAHPHPPCPSSQASQHPLPGLSTSDLLAWPVVAGSSPATQPSGILSTHAPDAGLHVDAAATLHLARAMGLSVSHSTPALLPLPRRWSTTQQRRRLCLAHVVHGGGDKTPYPRHATTAPRSPPYWRAASRKGPRERQLIGLARRPGAFDAGFDVRVQQGQCAM